MPSVRTGIPLQRGVYGKVVRDSSFSLKFMAERTTGNVTSGDVFNSGEVFSNISAPIFSRQRGNVIKRERKTMSLKGGLKKEK